MFITSKEAKENGFEFKIEKGEVTITGFNGIESGVIIPQAIDGIAVTAIGERAFYDRRLSEVLILEGITTIGESAFELNQLTSILIPEGVITIGDRAFDRNRLRKIGISGSVTGIGYGAFAVDRDAELHVEILTRGKYIPSSLMLLGPPGSGKSTQAKILSDYCSFIPILNPDKIIDISRRHYGKSGNPLELMVLKNTDYCLLVPDELVTQIMVTHFTHYRCREGFILDGFPRNLAQAKMFEKRHSMGLVGGVVSLEIKDEDAIKRITGKRICSRCKFPYHVEFNPPKREGICDKCGKKLITKAEDSPDAVINRFKEYREQLQPVVEYYSNHGVFFCSVDATQSVEDVTKSILAAFEKDYDEITKDW